MRVYVCVRVYVLLSTQKTCLTMPVLPLSLAAHAVRLYNVCPHCACVYVRVCASQNPIFTPPLSPRSHTAQLGEVCALICGFAACVLWILYMCQSSHTKTRSKHLKYATVVVLVVAGMRASPCEKQFLFRVGIRLILFLVHLPLLCYYLAGFLHAIAAMAWGFSGEHEQLQFFFSKVFFWL